MSLDTLAEKVRQSGLPYVCITGGEPLLQGDELEELLSFLHKRGIIIDIETNGTVDFTRYQPYASICMDVKCPSSGEQSNIGLLSKVRPQDSVKFVVKDEPDCRYAEGVMNSHRIAGEVFFSPVFGTDYSDIYKFILANNLPVRFQIQLHKILGVR